MLIATEHKNHGLINYLNYHLLIKFYIITEFGNRMIFRSIFRTVFNVTEKSTYWYTRSPQVLGSKLICKSGRQTALSGFGSLWSQSTLWLFIYKCQKPCSSFLRPKHGDGRHDKSVLSAFVHFIVYEKKKKNTL